MGGRSKEKRQEKKEAQMRERVKRRKEAPKRRRLARIARERERNPPRKRGQVLPKSMERPPVEIVEVSARKAVLDELACRVPPEDARLEWIEGMSLRTGLPQSEVKVILEAYGGARMPNRGRASLPHEVAQAAARALGATVPMAIRVVQEAMGATKLVSVGGELVSVPDHKTRREAAALILDIHGSKAPVTNKIEHTVKDDLSELSDEELAERERKLVERARKIEAMEEFVND